ncbi:MAG: MFS transporter [Anaerolineales bacterium]|nr:MAG: MFS transporter [Anaerolineales bacterium]
MATNLGASQKWGVLIAVGIGTFMTALDTSVVNTVLPVIGQNFNQVITVVEWVVTIYLLVLSGLLLSFGRLGDMRGHKTIYLIGFGIFMAGSFFSGSAPSVVILIIARGLQALGAAMLAANSPAILTKSFPAEQRGQALGLQATMTYLGLTAGPALGGWLASLLGWRVVFYINLPVGVAAIWLSLRFIPKDTHSQHIERFDFGGAVTFLLGLGSLLLALNQGEEWGWTSVPILILFGAALAFLALFIYLEKHVKFPMLDLSLFTKLPFSLTTVSAILNYIGVYTCIFMMPYYLIQGRGFTPAQAGLVLTAQPIIMAIVAPISGTLSDRIGTRIPTVIGMAVLSAGLFLLSRLSPQASIASVMLALAVVGLGTGVFISPNNSALMGSAPRGRQGIAAGILATARNFGMVLGVGIAGAVFTTVLVHAGGVIGSSVNPAQNGAIFAALSVAFMVASMITLLGVITCLVRVKNHS